jgi:uncharacterized membrane protein
LISTVRRFDQRLALLVGEVDGHRAPLGAPVRAGPGNAEIDVAAAAIGARYRRHAGQRAVGAALRFFAAETISALLVMQPREEPMVTESRRGIRSTASIGGHPVHPMLVPFPIAFLVGTLATDLAFWGTGDAFWARASAWLVGAGVVMGLLAAAFGFIDFVTIDRARTGSTGWVHALGNLLAVVLSFVSLLFRIGDAQGSVLPTGLVLSFIVVAILAVTGWMGGELAYRYKIGVIEDGGA